MTRYLEQCPGVGPTDYWIACDDGNDGKLREQRSRVETLASQGGQP